MLAALTLLSCKSQPPKPTTVPTDEPSAASTSGAQVSRDSMLGENRAVTELACDANVDTAQLLRRDRILVRFDDGTAQLVDIENGPLGPRAKWRSLGYDPEEDVRWLRREDGGLLSVEDGSSAPALQSYSERVVTDPATGEMWLVDTGEQQHFARFDGKTRPSTLHSTDRLDQSIPPMAQSSSLWTSTDQCGVVQLRGDGSTTCHRPTERGALVRLGNDHLLYWTRDNFEIWDAARAVPVKIGAKACAKPVYVGMTSSPPAVALSCGSRVGAVWTPKRLLALPSDVRVRDMHGNAQEAGRYIYLSDGLYFDARTSEVVEVDGNLLRVSDEGFALVESDNGRFMTDLNLGTSKPVPETLCGEFPNLLDIYGKHLLFGCREEVPDYDRGRARQARKRCSQPIYHPERVLEAYVLNLDSGELRELENAAPVALTTAGVVATRGDNPLMQNSGPLVMIEPFF